MTTMKRAGGVSAGAVLAAALALGTLAAPAPADAQQTLKVGTWAMPGGRGDPFTARGTPSVFVWSAMFDRLTAITATGDVVPDSVSGWTNVNPTTWRFTLKEGGTFHNGEKYDAAAVKATFDYLLSTEGKTKPVGQWINILDSVSAVDAKTVEFVTKSPYPAWTKQIAVVWMVAPKAWADMGSANFANAPVGSGAYKLARMAPESVSVEAYDGALKKRANISKIDFVALSEPATRNQALLSGQIDIDTDVGVDNIKALEAAKFVVNSVPAANTHGISFLTTKADSPWKDKRLRQAANYAVNKDAIIAGVYGGRGAPSSQHSPPVAFGYNPNLKPYPYDPAMAKKLLAEAGYPNGIDLNINVVQIGVTLSNAMQAAANDLNAVGIRTKLLVIPVPELIGKFLNGGWAPEIHAFGTASDMAGHLDVGVGFSSFYSCAKATGTIHCDEAEMPLVRAAAAEFDPDKRRKILQDLLAMNRDNAPLIFMAEQQNSMGYAPKVKNFKNEVFVLNYHEMRIE